jgi:hypothetical protein
VYDAYVQGVTLEWGSLGPCAGDWVLGVSELLSVVIALEIRDACCADYLSLCRIGPRIPSALVVLTDRLEFGGTRIELGDIARLSPIGPVKICYFVVFVGPLISVDV